MQQLKGLDKKETCQMPHCGAWTDTHTAHVKCQTQTDYLSLKIFLKLQTGNRNALLPLARPSAQ